MSDGTGAAEPATPRKAVRNRPSKAAAMGSPRFKKIRKLGAGAFGNVFLCIDLATTQEVVAKEIAIRSKAERDDSILEAKLLGAVSHFNIIKYLDVHHAGASHVMIYMELANDGDIDEKIGQRKAKQLYFQSSTVMQWAVQLCQAVAHLHGEGFIHRDLKVANLFLTVEGFVKLGDFGIAKILEGDSRSRMSARFTRTPVGTPMYISPQVCNGEAYNQKADVWGVGCCLYEICALRPAFVARSMDQLMAKIKRGQHGDEVPFHFNDDIHDLIDDLLTIEADSRPSITEVLEQPMFDRWLPGSPAVMIAAGKPPVPYPRLVDPEATRRRLMANSAPNILTLDTSVRTTSPSSSSVSPPRHATGTKAGMSSSPPLAPLSRSPLSDGSPTSQPGSKSPASDRRLERPPKTTLPGKPLPPPTAMKMRLKDISAPVGSPLMERVRKATPFVRDEGPAPLGGIATTAAPDRTCEGADTTSNTSEANRRPLSTMGKVTPKQPDAKSGAADHPDDSNTGRKKRQPSPKHRRNKSDGAARILLSSGPAVVVHDEFDPTARNPRHRRNKSDGTQQILAHKAHRRLAELELRGGRCSPAVNRKWILPKAPSILTNKSTLPPGRASPESQLLAGLSPEAPSCDSDSSPTQQGRRQTTQSTTPTSERRRERPRSSSFGDDHDRLGHRGPAGDTVPLEMGLGARASSWDDGRHRAARVSGATMLPPKRAANPHKLADLSQFYRAKASLTLERSSPQFATDSEKWSTLHTAADEDVDPRGSLGSQRL